MALVAMYFLGKATSGFAMLIPQNRSHDGKAHLLIICKHCLLFVQAYP